MMKKTRGFTLIEVLIVVVIIGVLAAVAIPYYRDRIAKGRQAVAVAHLQAARLAMENYYARNKAYLTSSNSVAELLETGEFADSTDSNAQYHLTITSTDPQAGYLIRAECNIDADATIDTWTINNLGQLTNNINDVKF